MLYRSTFVLLSSRSDADGRFVSAEFRSDGVVFRLVSLYAPNRDPARADFYNYVIDSVDPSVPTVNCGDFNTAFNCSLDRRGTDALFSMCDGSSALGHLFSECCVVDVWRHLHPGVSAFTWTRLVF